MYRNSLGMLNVICEFLWVYYGWLLKRCIEFWFLTQIFASVVDKYRSTRRSDYVISNNGLITPVASFTREYDTNGYMRNVDVILYVFYVHSLRKYLISNLEVHTWR